MQIGHLHIKWTSQGNICSFPTYILRVSPVFLSCALQELALFFFSHLCLNFLQLRSRNHTPKYSHVNQLLKLTRLYSFQSFHLDSVQSVATWPPLVSLYMFKLAEVCIISLADNLHRCISLVSTMTTIKCFFFGMFFYLVCITFSELTRELKKCRMRIKWTQLAPDVF